MKRLLLAAIFAAMAPLTSAAVLAQQPPTPPKPAVAPQAPLPLQPVQPIYQVTTDAATTREQLQELLRQYPPVVGEVLRRDPTLLARADYIAPYPQLVAFLQQHPEVARNPSFFFGGYDYYERRNPPSPEIETLGALLGGMAVFFGVSAAIGVLIWVVRAVFQHRRWLRLTRTQSEVHLKLMDRMATNEELLAYIQSPAGRRFLESTPIQQDSDTLRTAAPVGPILWSMMAGIVFATVGAGFRLAGRSGAPEAQQAFTVVGVIILSLGAGFIISSVMAYLVSSRLGLFPKPASPVTTSDHA